jgi:hypothetical protein
MKKVLFVTILLVTVPLFAVDKSSITVKHSSTNNGVILVNISEEGKTLELQCTESAPNCKAPQPGTYWMVRLPKNWGLYDCANVDLYAQNQDPEQGEKFGEYCLNEK